VLPKFRIPFFDIRNIGTYKGQHGKEDQHHAGVYMLLEFT
jgi:hypothetical protein